MRVCRDATFGTKANSEADVPNEEDTVGEARRILLVLVKSVRCMLT